MCNHLGTLVNMFLLRKCSSLVHTVCVQPFKYNIFAVVKNCLQCRSWQSSSTINYIYVTTNKKNYFSFNTL